MIGQREEPGRRGRAGEVVSARLRAVRLVGQEEPAGARLCCRVVRAMAEALSAALADWQQERRRPERDRRRERAHLTQISMYLCHVGLRLPQAAVGRGFGRDRTTVSYACSVVEDRRDDPGYDAFVVSLGRLVGAVFTLEEDGDATL